MTEYETRSQEGIDLDDRDRRALEQYLTVLEDYGRAKVADNLYMVVSQSGDEYLVDDDLGACECPDAEYRDPEGGCKHVRRVRFATRGVPEEIPDDVDVDPQLGIHVADVPTPDAGGSDDRVAMTDGGVAVQKESVESAFDVSARIGHVVGIDAEGEVHAYYATAGLVRVFEVPDGFEIGDRLDMGDVVREQRLETRPLSDWMQYVAEKRGWTELTHRAPEFGGDL